ncbi:sodium bicarbonate cotransporter 3-like protein [Dinothrombium tinctorium]|uniref:Anion exchange protein n=1 Tax=Dinothrombium tinctorium TaxID=1965070 RepID=A0A3S3PNT4_9ACAR|nr:sodium bicarbonate cotransporter 3-like protein [Dinothrombium tinctorium]RWS13497.1 sodium bicarbonate cotransporter 3-like protein [Dinothrombium tinctorium]RWS13499.1 sodium bicarbonate cotransporter 3-like protein [Dinothrombium tinctorium]
MEDDKRNAMDEAAKDPGAFTSHSSYTDKDFEGHRAHAVYVGFHVPGGYKRRQHHRRHRHHHKNGQKRRDDGTLSAEQQDTRPGEDDVDGTHESHPLFSELEELCGDGNEQEWRETARWIKFEEDVEEGGDRWSKPHVATISLHSLFELRSCINNGTVMLDLDGSSLDQIADLVLENMVNHQKLAPELKEKVKEALLRRHRHQHEKKHDHQKSKQHGLPLIRSLADIGRNSSKSMFSAGSNHESSGGLPQSPSATSLHLHPSQQQHHSGASLSDNNASSSDLQHRANQAFMRKIPPGSEADNILVGEVDFLDHAISAFVRLHQACHLGDLTEVPVPTRFLFILLGPHSIPGRYHEVGRAMATLMSDEVFHDVAYKAKSRQDLLAGVDEFLDAVTILPPGAWDPSIRIEPPQQIPSQDARKKGELQEQKTEELEEEDEEKEREQNGLKRTGRLFGGLINDIKRKAPWYLSDFKDALALQSVASIFFLYFACLTPIITFGGLLGQATGKNIATMESLLSGAICGIIYGLFSGQPLTILGSTGPVLVFEGILFDFCKTTGWEYLPLRLWIGLWTAVILLVLVALDASAFVCYITRFTEENFATLISVIFIYKAVEKVSEIFMEAGIVTPTSSFNYTCYCRNKTFPNSEPWLVQEYNRNKTALDSCLVVKGELFGPGCKTPNYVPNVFLFSVILFLCTYFITLILKDFKTKSFFPTQVRHIISDFAVVIAILASTSLDIYIGLDTPKLQVPEEFKPTSSDRNWLIPPFGRNPWWTAIAAPIPALLATILIFMDQQITAVIINRKENKLKKGCGYHLDLFILSLLIAICSILGLPWFVAATVLSMSHVNSLKMESKCAAPGEKPQFLGVREQRVTHIMIFVLCGLSVLFTSTLGHIPMPVLYGVFLYMGTSSLQGSQFYQRILILFMPQKYQPDLMFLRHVRTFKVHVFTCIQLVCFVCLWVIKSYKPTSIAFPLMLVVMIGVRKSLDFCFFTQRELKILDDVMPESTRRKKEEEKVEKESKDQQQSKLIPNASSGNVAIPLANGNILKIPVDKFNSESEQMNINITEQLSQSGCWKTIDQQKQKEAKKQEKSNNNKKKRGSKKDALTPEEQKRLSTMAEEDDEEDCGITIRIDAPTPIPSALNSPQDEHGPDNHNKTSETTV